MQYAVPLCGAVLGFVFLTAALEKGTSLSNVTNWLQTISVPLPQCVGLVTVILEIGGVVLLLIAPTVGAIVLMGILLVGSPLLYASSRAGVECGCFGKPKKLTRNVLLASFIRNGLLLGATVTLLIGGNNHLFDERYRLFVVYAVFVALFRVLLLRRANLSRKVNRGAAVVANLIWRERYDVGNHAPKWMVRSFEATPDSKVGVIVDPADVAHWRSVSERHVGSPVCVIPSQNKLLETPLAIALWPSGVIRGIGHVGDSYELQLFTSLALGP